MGASIILQALTTIEGDSSATNGTEFYQPLDEWGDLGNFADVILCVQAKSVVTTGTDTLDLSLRTLTEKDNPSLTTDSPEPGFATELWKLTNLLSGDVKKTTVYLDQGNPSPLERYLMWVVSINGTTGPWRLTFQITLTAKRAA